MVARYAARSAGEQWQGLPQQLVPDVNWPPHLAEMAALVDLSMSLPTIAYYLVTPESRVAALLDYYGIQVPRPAI